MLSKDLTIREGYSKIDKREGMKRGIKTKGSRGIMTEKG